jgi:hypothetical protein
MRIELTTYALRVPVRRHPASVDTISAFADFRRLASLFLVSGLLLVKYLKQCAIRCWHLLDA